MFENATLDSATTRMFSWSDYILFSAVLGLSLSIGIYFGCCKKQNTPEKYLLGGKTMSIYPIALSLIASHISGMALLAVPADVYVYGSNSWWLCVCYVVVYFITSYVYLPVFSNLRITSVFEYLQVRFDKRISMLASALYTLQIFFYNPVIIYLPVLAFSQVTGINKHLIIPIVCAACVFYTAIGGLKAVVWTDALQFIGIIGSCIAIAYVGTASAGGLESVWTKATEGHRLDLFNLNFDPTIRDSPWPILIGGTVYWTGIGALHQETVQKFLAVPTINKSRRVVAMYFFGMITLISLCVFTGNVIYAKYYTCDPLSTKQIERNDQIVPYFVVDVARGIPGLTSIFIAGIFSASLSTFSSTLNAVSGTIYKDFIALFLTANITEKQKSNILKTIVAVSGAICTAMVFVVELMPEMLPILVTFEGISGGPLVGLFTLGMLFPPANSTGALAGSLVSLLCISWIAIGSYWYSKQGLSENAKHLSTSGCKFYFNTTLRTTKVAKEVPHVIYRINFWYYSFISTLIVVAVGLLISWLTRTNKTPVDLKLISPVAHFAISNRNAKKSRASLKYLHVAEALSVIENETKDNN